MVRMMNKEVNTKKNLKELKRRLNNYPLNVEKFHLVELEDFDIDAYYLEFFIDAELKDFFSKIFTDLMEKYSYGIRFSMRERIEKKEEGVDISIWFYKRKIVEDFINLLDERLSKDK